MVLLCQPVMRKGVEFGLGLGPVCLVEFDLAALCAAAPWILFFLFAKCETSQVSSVCHGCVRYTVVR